jgi:hypothetical protein
MSAVQEFMKSVHTKTHVSLPIFLLLWCARLFAQPSLDGEKIPTFDYSQTELIIFYGEEGHVYLGPVFGGAPGMGALVYEMILLYVPHFQEIIIPPINPTHVMDLTMRDRNGWRRIGQRLYVGNAWLSDGKNIAFMKVEDYQRLAGLLRDRYAAAGGDVYGPEHLADMRLPTKDELPDDWLPDAESVGKAIDRMAPSDFEYEGYDPGAAIRRRASQEAGQEAESRHENHADEAKLHEKVDLKRRAMNDAPSTAQHSAFEQVPAELKLGRDDSSAPPVAIPQEKVPHRQVLQEHATLSEEKLATGDRNSRSLLLFAGGFAVLLSVVFLAGKRGTRRAGV